MRAINHALTGAVIGLAISNPAVAVATAFLSHFALDLIPHFEDEKRAGVGTPAFTTILIADALACGLFVLVLLLTGSDDWFQASLCAFAATSPDLMWMPRYLRSRVLGYDPGPKGWLQQFHHHIQRYAWPGGFLVELPWAVGMIFLITKLI